MKKATAHIISHTHWDREWYMSYERHHVKLIQLMDCLLDLLDTDPEFESFHLDGQTIILEDYLQVRPESRSKLEKYIREGRICIGPWYILQDEFLTSSEANIRNLQIGMLDAKKFGAVTRIGYFPDAFGNMGQAPQILKQAGMKAAVFGRGVKAIGFNNQNLSCDRYESPYSEMIWQSPDGSNILGILFPNWYNNGNEIPVDHNQAKEYWQDRIKTVAEFSSTEHYLFMNGCDHQPVQTDLSKALQTARSQFPEFDFVHTNFEDYIDNVQSALTEPLAVVEGELRSQDTDGLWTLVNTASSRIYLKQMNQHNQVMLEKVAEPIAAFASSLGSQYPYHLLTYAWKTLMQNHPHDSICGCSVDAVHREMVTRFEKSMDVAKMVQEKSLQYITDSIDTSSFAKEDSNSVPFVIFNSTGWERDGVVTVDLDIDKQYGNVGPEMYSLLDSKTIGNFSLLDSTGRAIAYTTEDLGVCFGYDLPDDKFRQPYMARRIRLTFQVEEIPTLGYRSYALVQRQMSAPENQSLVTSNLQMENTYIKVQINGDGTLDITDKTSGHTFSDQCFYENVGDIGNEYVFVQPKQDTPIVTKGKKASIKLVEDTSNRATFEIKHQLEIPKSADELLEKEVKSMVTCHERKALRAKITVHMEIVTRVSLEKEGHGVKIIVNFNNPAKDHRLRVLFPTELKADTHLADSIFEMARRNNDPSAVWENPSNCQHQQAFVSLDDGEKGLTIANIGLNEYEVLQDGKNTIAITLLRAVGELGDWGVFPTPEGQCPGEHTVEFELIPHREDIINSRAFVEAYQFQVPLFSCQTSIHNGRIPADYSFVEWEGKDLVLSNIKRCEESGDLMMRWFNPTSYTCKLSVKPLVKVDTLYLSNVLEEKLSEIPLSHGDTWCIEVSKGEILTLGIKSE